MRGTGRGAGESRWTEARHAPSTVGGNRGRRGRVRLTWPPDHEDPEEPGTPLRSDSPGPSSRSLRSRAEILPMIEWKMCVPTSSVPSGGASDVRAKLDVEHLERQDQLDQRGRDDGRPDDRQGHPAEGLPRRGAVHSRRAPRSGGTWRSPPRKRIPRSGIARHVTAIRAPRSRLRRVEAQGRQPRSPGPCPRAHTRDPKEQPPATGRPLPIGATAHGRISSRASSPPNLRWEWTSSAAPSATGTAIRVTTPAKATLYGSVPRRTRRTAGRRTT